MWSSPGNARWLRWRRWRRATATSSRPRSSSSRAQVAQLRQSEQSTQQDDRLLKEIINHLPIGLTVQDENGRFILVNEIAAANLATPIEALIGASPADFLSAEDAVSPARMGGRPDPVGPA